MLMSTAAVIDDRCFQQQMETVDLKRVMFAASAKRLLLVDHTKFNRRALHGQFRLSEFDAVIVDDGIAQEDLSRLRSSGVNVVLAPLHAEQPAR
jgi:DeoR/GlpR family transcriptional regulator of sugar metabolism